jgi:hypothetical protein
MKSKQRAIVLAGAAVFALACKSEQAAEGGAEADKKAFEHAIAVLKQPIGRISAYKPHVALPESKEKYAWKRGADAGKAAMFAANEVRYAANEARQKIETKSANVTKDLEAALRTVSADCTDAAEAEPIAKCNAALKTLDDALAKTSAAGSALGAPGKLPRVAPESVTPEVTTAMAPYLKVKGPTPAEKTYAQKRGDSSASVADVLSACQAAAAEVSDIANQFEKADEAIRIIGVTHKMSMDAQCNGLTTADAIRSEVEGCKKKKKSTECSIACGKGKNLLDEGVPAAAFASLEKDHAEICAKQ